MEKQQKILVCGDVEGNFGQLYKKVASINKKAGPFDILFCVGSFFGDDDKEWQTYASGETKVPVPTCVLGPNKPEHKKYFTEEDGGDLAPNITYLGRKGVYVGSSGLRIAYLSGIDGSRQKDDDTRFTDDDVDGLLTNATANKDFKGVDILLTSAWTYGVEKYGQPVDGMAFDSKDCGSMALSQLAIGLKPRYHFVGLEGTYYERQPYRNHQVLAEGAKHVTRFISLANVGNPGKKKYLYAFNIIPMAHMDPADLVKQPQDSTECPYTVDPSRIKGKEVEKSAQFFYDQDVLDGKKGGHRGKRHHRDGHGGPQEKRKPQQPQGPCWFCLGSPSVEKHLVVSVGTHTYMALAKGGLTGDHVMILPIGHHQSIVSAPEEVIEEIDKYKTVLRKCFKSEGKSPVYFERNYKTSHLQIQVVPVPRNVVKELKETFEGCAVSHNIELAELPKHSDIRQIVPSGAPYFYAELPGGDKLLHRIKGPFPLQFGREVLAHDTLLDLPFRVDWRNCKTSMEEEAEAAKDFKKMFSPYEFNAV